MVITQPLFPFSASVNVNGSSCPMALRLIACVLLLEITAFMRETYKNLPKLHKHHLFTGASAATSAQVTGGAHPRHGESRASHAWGAAVASATSGTSAPLMAPPASSSNRRWSIALQSVGNQPAGPKEGALEKQTSLSSQVCLTTFFISLIKFYSIQDGVICFPFILLSVYIYW